MKKISLFILLGFCTYTLLAQEIERSVIATSGEDFSNENVNLSWTLGEVVTETFSSPAIVLNQGFQQVINGVVISGFDLEMMVFLEGPFEDDHMKTDLLNRNRIPLQQPFNDAPWYYDGDEHVAAIPPDVVDWMLIELRDADHANNASPGTVIAQRAAFLLSNGDVVDLDGSSIISFSETIQQQLFVVVWHRNHLGIMTAQAVEKVGGTYYYNFTDAMEKAYGNQSQKSFGSGYYGMFAGDANGDLCIGENDRTAYWNNQAGKSGYLSADFSMDGETNNQDKNNFWQENQSKCSHVPD